MISLFATIVLILAPIDDPKTKPAPKPPSKEEMAAIEKRGKLLAEYDQAVWHATDALLTQRPRDGSVQEYVARKTDQGWVVSFGRLDETKAHFLVAYEATATDKPDLFKVRSFEPARKETGFERIAAVAIGVAAREFTEHFEGNPRPYNVAVLPADGKDLWVYLVPAATKPNVWPLGGDARYRMSADGSKILQKRQLHRAIIENPPPVDDKGNKLVSGMHNHVLSDVPEDTDVFYVLTRKPAVGELVTTAEFVYEIKADGGLSYMGTAKELLKSSK